MPQNKFRAAVIREHGGFEKILFEERSASFPESAKNLTDPCLIEITHCGINHLDTWVRRGVPGHKFPLPLVPGSDIVGILRQVPPTSTLKLGSRVLVNPGLSCGVCSACQKDRDDLCVRWGLLGETADGGCQEYLWVNAQNVFVLPNDGPDFISSEDAACIPINFVTAWEMLVNKANLQKGETVLVHAVGSGVSVAAIQIAKVFDCKVIVTSTSKEKLLKAETTFGAIDAIHCNNEDGVATPFSREIKNLTAKRGVDVVVDHLGQLTIMESIKSLSKGGRLVSCGATTGSDVTIDWKHVFFKSLALLGSTYGSRKVFQTVVKQFQDKKMRGIIHARLPLTELRRAHELIENKATFGKIIVEVQK